MSEEIKVHLDIFNTNNEQINLDDIVTNFKTGITKEGVVLVNFSAKDKYSYVDAGGYTYMQTYQGSTLSISPIIYNEEGQELLESDMDKYFNHPDYYKVDMVLEGISSSTIARVIALKHEYMVLFIPFDIALNYGALKKVEIIDH